MNIDVQVFVWTYFISFWCMPMSTILSHTVTLCLTFWRASKLFPKYHFIPTSNVWRFQFFYILGKTCYCLSFLSIQFYYICSSVFTTKSRYGSPIPTRIPHYVFYNDIHLPSMTFPSSHQPLAITNLFSIPEISSFQKCYINGIIC